MRATPGRLTDRLDGVPVLGRLIAILAPFIVTFGAFITPAMAGPADGGIAGPGGVMKCASGESATTWIPAARWGGVSGATKPVTIRNEGFFENPAAFIADALTTVTGSLGEVGQAMWGWSAQLAGLSGDFCPMMSMGPSIDRIAAQIGTIILSPGIGAFLIIVSIGMVFAMIVRSTRMGTMSAVGALKRLVVPLLATTMLVLMTAGAGASQGSGDSFVPGRFSPSWWMGITSNTMDVVAGASLAGLESMTPAGLKQAPARTASASIPGSCVLQADDWARQDDTKGNGSARAVSRLWEQAGLPYYIDAQYGSADNGIGWNTHCRIMDWQVGNLTQGSLDSAPDHAVTLKRRDGGSGPNLKQSGPGPRFEWSRSGGFLGLGGTDQAQAHTASAVGWMVCMPADSSGNNWSVAAGAAELDITADDCSAWWNDETAPGGLHDFIGDDDKIKAAYAKNAPLVDAIDGFTSPRDMDLAGPFAMFISGLVALLVYGGVTLVIMGSKVGAVILGMFLIVAIIVGMWAGNTERVARFGKRTFGVLLVSFIGQALFTVITVLSMVMMAMGQAVLSASSTMLFLWSALAPLMAVALLHFGTKAIFGGSPFTFQGMKKMATEGIDPSALALGAGAGVAGKRAWDRLRGRSSAASSGEYERGGATAAAAGSPQKRTEDGLTPARGKAAADGQVAPGGDVHAASAGSEEAAAGVAAGAVGTLGSKRARAKALAAAQKGEAKRLGHEDATGDDALLGYRKDGKAVTRGGLAELNAADRRAARREMRDVARQDKTVAALARKQAWDDRIASRGKISQRLDQNKLGHAALVGSTAAWDKASSGQGLRGLGKNALNAPGAIKRGAGATTGWIARNPKKAAAYAATAGLAATGVGLPAAMALGATTAGVHTAGAARKRILDPGRDAARGGRVAAQHQLARQALADKGIGERIETGFDAKKANFERASEASQRAYGRGLGSFEDDREGRTYGALREAHRQEQELIAQAATHEGQKSAQKFEAQRADRLTGQEPPGDDYVEEAPQVNTGHSGGGLEQGATAPAAAATATGAAVGAAAMSGQQVDSAHIGRQHEHLPAPDETFEPTERSFDPSTLEPAPQGEPVPVSGPSAAPVEPAPQGEPVPVSGPSAAPVEAAQQAEPAPIEAAPNVADAPSVKTAAQAPAADIGTGHNTHRRQEEPPAVETAPAVEPEPQAAPVTSAPQNNAPQVETAPAPAPAPSPAPAPAPAPSADRSQRRRYAAESAPAQKASSTTQGTSSKTPTPRIEQGAPATPTPDITNAKNQASPDITQQINNSGKTETGGEGR